MMRTQTANHPDGHSCWNEEAESHGLITSSTSSTQTGHLQPNIHIHKSFMFVSVSVSGAAELEDHKVNIWDR
jgi:hypothetical protein